MAGKGSHAYTVALPEPKSNKMWHLITGGMAGGISRTVTSPLERLKILRQCSTPEYKNLSLLDSLQAFYTREGVKGFFKGNGSNVLKVVPFTALEFFCFAKAKDFVGPHPSKPVLLVCGSFAGAVATVVTYPIDLVRTALSINTSNEHQGIAQELKLVYKTHGLKGWYRGLGVSLLGIAPFIGFKMTTYDLLKTKYKPSHESPYFTLVNLALGATSGTVAMLLTYPTDLIRRKIQLISFKQTPYSGVADCCRYLYRTGGVFAFYRGVFPAFLKIAPAMAVVFSVNEKLKILLGIKG